MSDVTADEVRSVVTELGKLARRARPRLVKYGRKRQIRKNAKRKYSGWCTTRPDFDSETESRKWDDGMTKLSAGEADQIGDNPEFFLAGTCLNDHYISKVVDERSSQGLSTFHKVEDLVCESKDWISFINGLSDEWQIIQFGDLAGMAIKTNELSFIDYTITSSTVTAKLYGSEDFVNRTYDYLIDNFTVAKCHIEWVYSGDGSSVNIPLLGDKLPVSEMYPFLKDETIEEFYDRYLNSTASILLLIGPPGTGKTSFIRGLLHHTGKNAIVTYDETLLQKDYVFARFIEDDVGVMVMEDADNFLKSRRDGNTMMHRFLNVGDGLITVKGKKLVFSTNLPSINDIDPALTRPGRCFDILHFDNYTVEQVDTLTEKLGIEFKPHKKEGEKYSLAEVFHQQRHLSPKATATKLGFF